MDSVECYIDKKGEYRFRVRNQNGQIRSVSSEGYKREEDCLECMLATYRSIHAFVADHLVDGRKPLAVLMDCDLFHCEDEETAG